MDNPLLKDLPQGERNYWYRRIMRPFGEHGITDRTERLIHLSMICGRVITSAGLMTRDEAAAFKARFYTASPDGSLVVNQAFAEAVNRLERLEE